MREIGKELGVSIDAVTYFMRQHNLKRRTLSEQNRVVFDRKPLSFKIKKNLSMVERELKLISIALYWGEGYKAETSACVDFANSDPAMICIFYKFLKDICRVDLARIRMSVYCYSNQNPKTVMEFWSKLINVPLNQFTKPYIRSDFRKDKRNKMPQGLVHIRYADKKLLIQIREWIEEYKVKYCVGA